MTSSPTPPDERRAAPRQDKQLPVRLQLDATALSGTSENISGVGILFFTDDSLRVNVEIEEDGRTRTRSGRLVRVQRMTLDSTGFAVEFDPE